MTKSTIILIISLLPFLSKGQNIYYSGIQVGFGINNKIDKYHYMNVDTLIAYDNADIIIYKNEDNKEVKDTLFLYGKTVNIEKVDEMIVNEGKLKRPKKSK